MWLYLFIFVQVDKYMEEIRRDKKKKEGKMNFNYHDKKYWSHLCVYEHINKVYCLYSKNTPVFCLLYLCLFQAGDYTILLPTKKHGKRKLLAKYLNVKPPQNKSRKPKLGPPSIHRYIFHWSMNWNCHC